MMSRYLLKTRGYVDSILVIHMGSVPVSFRRVLTGGKVHMLADIHEMDRAEEALACARASRDFEILDDLPTDLMELTSPPKVAAPSRAIPRPPTAWDLALKNGWTQDDFQGAGNGGNAGNGGGRSQRTGLTIGEMALCKAPTGWDALGASRYPWQILDWTPPGLGFSPPSVPPKPPLPEESPPVLPLEETPEEVLASAPSPEGDGSLDLSGYGTAEEIAAAVAMIRSATQGAEVPKKEALIYRFRKAGLPSVRTYYSSLIAAAAAS